MAIIGPLGPKTPRPGKVPPPGGEGNFKVSDLRDFLREISFSLMFLDHFHIIASLENLTIFFFKANLTLYLPQVLTTNLMAYPCGAVS